ncbi:hypothetical protein Taro_047395 [Colocasia esculenta]|uniref:Uncharacterized protein n=1 Tax=Colocasia esculenta TaxID=4460 RepID=A0A843X734_COLES|nr:hypothetical protein [Colocasia esculenta]
MLSSSVGRSRTPTSVGSSVSSVSRTTLLAQRASLYGPISATYRSLVASTMAMAGVLALLCSWRRRTLEPSSNSSNKTDLTSTAGGDRSSAMDCRGNMYRIRECACNLLLAMEDDLAGDDEDAWELMARDIRLRSTFLFCDLNRLISIAGDGEVKLSLTALANRLFYHMEELGRAIKSRSVPQAESCYGDAAVVLQEVVAAMVPSH